MDLPDIAHPIRDAERNVTYVVMAFRKLTQAEVITAVRVHLSQTRKKPKKNTRVVIFTVLGATPNL